MTSMTEQCSVAAAVVLDRKLCVPMWPEGVPHYRADLHHRYHAQCAGELPATIA